MLTTCFATVIQIHGREEKNTLLLDGLELSLQQDHLPLGIHDGARVQDHIQGPRARPMGYGWDRGVRAEDWPRKNWGF